MNIAFPAVVIFFLLAPGFTARTQIQKLESEVIDYSPFGAVVAQALLWALFLHGIWIACMHGWSDKVFAPEYLLGLLSSNANLQLIAIAEVAGQWPDIASYFASMHVFSFMGPWLVRLCIVKYRIDRDGALLAPLCRFNRAPWYYLLSGADLEKAEEADTITVSAVVDVGGGAYLYLGYLEKWHVDRDGRLDRLVLSNAMCRGFGEGGDFVSVDDQDLPLTSETARFSRVAGDYLVLRYDQVSTLNVSYRELPKESKLELDLLERELLDMERPRVGANAG
ncbi:MAG: hypothetical protein JHC82_07070 [Stenotrophomonas sp.]|nr:hypothetical protein [Stenotrophomonas sp.]